MVSDPIKGRLFPVQGLHVHIGPIVIGLQPETIQIQVLSMEPTPFHHHDRCVIVFGRYPRPGRVKTRLIPSLGPLGAADLHRWLTESVIRNLLAADLGKVCYCHEGADERQIRRWLSRPALCLLGQRAGDLGQRMATALNHTLGQGFGRVVLVGTDLPDLTADHVKSAFQALADHDLVLGPSSDGGYWLVGAKKPVPIFDHIPWGSDQVLTRTLAAAQALGLKTALIDTLSDLDTPEDLLAWPSGRRWQSPYLSVVIPTLNEADHIQDAVRQVRASHTQIIVADGGSRDTTVQLARTCGAAVVNCPPGRAVQQNLGARQATGRVLLFFHADTRLPSDFEAQVFEVLLDSRVALGAFGFKTDRHDTAMRLIEKTARLRASCLHLPYGDQAFFLRREYFDRIGGFPVVPIAEDLLLARRIACLGRIEIAPGDAVTSSRRWRQLGIARTTLVNYLIAGGCLIGINPARLAPLYDLWMKKR